MPQGARRASSENLVGPPPGAPRFKAGLWRVRMTAGAAGEAKGKAAKLGVRLVISCFWDYGIIPELDIKARSIYICTARMVFSS
jgi:hypothetical protein